MRSTPSPSLRPIVVPSTIFLLDWTIALFSAKPFSMRAIEMLPDAHGHFGVYGGMFVPETLVTALHELAAEYERAKNDPQFQNALAQLLRDFAGRPTPLY